VSGRERTQSPGLRVSIGCGSVGVRTGVPATKQSLRSDCSFSSYSDRWFSPNRNHS